MRHARLEPLARLGGRADRASKERRHLDLSGVAAGPARARRHVRRRAPGPVERARGQDRAVGDLAADLEHRAEDPGQVDRDDGTQRAKPEVESLDLQQLAPMRDDAVAQERADHVDRLPQALDGPGVRQPVLAHDLDAVARPETEDEAAAGEVIHRGRRHGDGRRAADEDARDARAESDARGLDGAGGEHGELVPAMPLGDPGAVVPEILGELHALDDLGRSEPSAEGDAEPRHDRSPAPLSSASAWRRRCSRSTARRGPRCPGCPCTRAPRAPEAAHRPA